MTNAEWWSRVVQARTQRADLLPQRVWALRKDGHEVAIDLRAVPGVGAELVLTVDGELRRTRLYRAHEQAELSGAIADTRPRSRRKGGCDSQTPTMGSQPIAQAREQAANHDLKQAIDIPPQQDCQSTLSLIHSRLP